MNDLNGRIVLITGAKGGLGSAVTPAFLNAGATVAGVSRSIAVTDFPQPRFEAFPAELSNEENATDLIGRVFERFGRIDAVVHLMGSWAGGARIEDAGASTLDRMLDVNLRSTFFIMSAGVRIMRAQRSGRLLAVGSKAAVAPQAGSVAYSASKAAVVSLMQGLAEETRDCGVTANVVLPGTIDTPQNRAANPTGDFTKWVQPCQIAELLVYLASDRASNISGAAIPIYGAS